MPRTVTRAASNVSGASPFSSDPGSIHGARNTTGPELSSNTRSAENIALSIILARLITSPDHIHTARPNTTRLCSYHPFLISEIKLEIKVFLGFSCHTRTTLPRKQGRLAQRPQPVVAATVWVTPVDSGRTNGTMSDRRVDDPCTCKIIGEMTTDGESRPHGRSRHCAASHARLTRPRSVRRFHRCECRDAGLARKHGGRA